MPRHSAVVQLVAPRPASLPIRWDDYCCHCSLARLSRRQKAAQKGAQHVLTLPSFMNKVSCCPLPFLVPGAEAGKARHTPRATCSPSHEEVSDLYPPALGQRGVQPQGAPIPSEEVPLEKSGCRTDGTEEGAH